MSGDVGGPAAERIDDDLLILFPRNGRPTTRQVRAQCDSGRIADSLGPEIVHYTHKVDIAPPDGVALQRAGLAFDLVGLAPGPAIPVPDIGEGGAVLRASKRSMVDASSLRLGSHIAAGARSLTVLREWFGIAEAIASAFDATSVCWVPGSIVIAPDRLAEALHAWDTRGEVPVTLLASFRATLDGAFQSQGLAYFTGQELRLEPQLMRGEEELLARLIFTHLFYAGKQEDTIQLAAPDEHALRLVPSGNGRVVRVWPG